MPNLPTEIPVLTTERLVLRPVAEADVTVLTEILQQPEVAEWWPRYDEPRVREDFLECEPEEDATVVFAMEYEGTTVGVIQYWEEPEEDYRYAGMDIFLTRDVHGRGLGTEALRAVIAHLFSVRDHHRLIIDPCEQNTRAMRTYENLGFQRVGRMRKYERGPDGQWRDSILYDLLREEWTA